MPDAGALADQITAVVLRRPVSPARRLIAIAGPPATGKTTVAALVRDTLTARGQPTALLPMDGFHLENDELDRLGLRARKGAPETFDLAGFRATVARLTDTARLKVPGFDRVRDCTVPNANVIEPAEKLVVVEGNYLLLDEPGWRDLKDFWDLSFFIETDLATLEARLVRRWIDHHHSAEEAHARVHANDLPNAVRVLENRLPPTQVLSSG